MKTIHAHIKLAIAVGLCSIFLTSAQESHGYELWLGYQKVENAQLLTAYQNLSSSIYFQEGSETLSVAKAELSIGLEKMLREPSTFVNIQNKTNSFIVAKKESLDSSIREYLASDFNSLGKEGFILKKN